METLKDLRIQSKKTCAEVAKELGVTIQTMYRYEQGARQINIEQVLIFAELYDCTEREVIEAALSSSKK